MDQASRRINIVRTLAFGLAAAVAVGMTYLAPEVLVPTAPLAALAVWYLVRRWAPEPRAIPDAPAPEWTKSQVLAIRIAGFAAAVLVAGCVTYFGSETIRPLGVFAGALVAQAIFYGAGVPLDRWENPYPSSNALGDALRTSGNGLKGPS